MQQSQSRPIRWRRFTRKSYAAFNSLHREVVIGVLSAAMLQSMGVLAKAGVARDVLTHPADGEADTMAVALSDVEVTGTRVPLTAREQPRMVTVMRRDDIAQSSAHSINDLLEYAVGVDVRQRGAFGVQTDISVGGGTFDQVTLLLNGINISSPHTGHLSADFPVSVTDIERIEVIEGPAARVFGTQAFTGVINIVTREAETSGAELHLGGGAYGYALGDARLSLTHRLGAQARVSHSLSGGYSRSDGATDNSFFSNTHLFYRGSYRSDGLTIAAQAGYSYKPYGANTFYGLASTDQWESNERIMAAVNAEARIGRVSIKPTAYWNRWYDHYQWHRHVSPGGENFHRVDVGGVGLSAWTQTALGKTSVGFELRHEAILSTSLGTSCDPKPTGGHDADGSRSYDHDDCRTNLSAFVEHDLVLRHWTLSLGLLANHNTGLSSAWRFYPGIDIAFRPTHISTLFASWNMALRMPTFTDLYYSGANIEGNSNLSPERATDAALGLRLRPRAWSMEAQAFYSHKTDMIDWAVYAGETVSADGTPTDPKTWVYRSGNFLLDNYGLSIQTAFMPREQWGEAFPVRRVAVSYAYISEHICHERPVALSKYAQEYLRHKIVLSADTRVWKRLTLSLAWRWQDRVGEGNRPYALLDARLAWASPRLKLYLDADNLLGRRYFDYSTIPQPGRWIKAGMIIRM